MAEIKHYLRKVSFPQVVSDALRQIEQLWSCMGLVDALQNCPKIVHEVIDEFIFQDIDRRGNPRRPRRPLTPIKELQVLNCIENHFLQQTNDVKANNLFLVLFPIFPPFQCHEDRLNILSRLLSTAIVHRNPRLLTSGGIWMQINGCTNAGPTKIAETIINDYFRLVPSSLPYLEDLPRISPVFCASLISAIASWFSSIPIYSEVVKVVYKWVNTTPLLCIAPLHAAYPLARPQTPLLSLLLWAVLAPLNDVTTKSFQWNLGSSLDGTNESLEQIYSGLHLAMLDTMLKVTQTNLPLPVIEILTMRDIMYVVDSLQVMINRSGKTPKVEVALNRLGQALQVAIATGCLKGNLIELFARLSNFPCNRLLRIVNKHYSGNLG